ncbi:DUF732 domain-containing protein [Streptacidiphilus monticola]|uniref:DUF732 domain-containing protein n=1 Tax=Streptacidiphilus monticola TaxID=2161674 RepID=A0ABW1G251_9ACTN
MDKRSDLVRIAASAAGVGLVLVGCSAAPSTSRPAPARPTVSAWASPTRSGLALNVPLYLDDLRGQAAFPGPQRSQFKDLSPKASSDARLVAVGREACTLLRTRQPAGVMAALKSAGWSGPEAVAIIIGASQPDAFCPDRYHLVTSWVRQQMHW